MTSQGRRPRRAAEDGAVVVMVALLAGVLFTLAAIAVDLGNMYSRDRQLQTQVDLVALAAGAHLPNDAANAVSIAAALDTFTLQNQIGGQDETTWNFSDADVTNGHVEFDGPNKIRVFAPHAWVDFGFARVFGGGDGSSVSAAAAVEIRSPGNGPMPFFAVTGCDYGLQSLSDGQPNSSTPPSSVPPLSNSGNPSNATATTVDPQATVEGNPVAGMSITGTGFTSNAASPPVVKDVGFFRTQGSTPDTVTLGGSGFTVGSATQITVAQVPTAVTDTVDTWYVRVLVEERVGNDRVERWTAAATGATLTVQSPNPPPTFGWSECAADPMSGNFGSIELPRRSTADAGKWVEMNMLTGLDPELSLAEHPSAGTTCSPTDGPPTVTSTNRNDINPDTNCINTSTGFPGSEATRGLIQGLDDHDGLLDTPTSENPSGTTDGCAPDGSSSSMPTQVQRRGNGDQVSVNNDLLTCFLRNDSTTLGQIAQPDATFPASARQAISEAIFRSPRFVWVPLFATQPANGMGYYQLRGFRPGFITDQPATATRANRQVGTGSSNGLVFTTNRRALKAIRVLFFNDQALPDVAAATGPSVEYLGYGTKIPTLVE